MKQLGGALFVFGIGSMVLIFFQMEFVILSWIETWGDQVAWFIRGGMAVVGAVLWLIGHKQENAQVEPEAG